ncbi:hypothetical protein BABINDRAFT_31000 [Babjeviella inositovora NRRL Y-12698]|uniref:ABC transporter domain-containing protein n=1 Tax=Babjeviella inositovora NRRL Y-12698 TaxID=984486 RepID=A0A1E3QYM1_9ASCO|nr:uncharacterized protein BABINDRAFT_31000 [Babjeviella inositovora NRRL Y-12698]ODQ82187.1 hypothetical protein BABINDRAFT_31000 [Babjeviella inositovora NRRL Y-12698]
MNETELLAIKTTHLTYTFPQTDKVGLADINLDIPWGTSNLLIGPNGAGKSTLLKILAGKTLTKAGSVFVNGSDPFRASNGNNGLIHTTYLGTEWASNPIVRRDIPVVVLLASIGGNDYPERRDLLVKLLDIDITWRMNNVSDGERRRVQLAMGLLQPWKLLLLDEVTVDLDVLVRNELLKYLKSECVTRGCCVIYATHIFDGLGNWPDKIIHISGGGKLDDVQLHDIDFSGASTVSQSLTVTDNNNKRTMQLTAVPSLHPLALYWLTEDILSRGLDREQGEKNRPSWDELKERMEGLFYDGDSSRVTEYFKKTRKT